MGVSNNSENYIHNCGADDYRYFFTGWNELRLQKDERDGPEKKRRRKIDTSSVCAKRWITFDKALWGVFEIIRRLFECDSVGITHIWEVQICLLECFPIDALQAIHRHQYHFDFGQQAIHRGQQVLSQVCTRWDGYALPLLHQFAFRHIFKLPHQEIRSKSNADRRPDNNDTFDAAKLLIQRKRNGLSGINLPTSVHSNFQFIDWHYRFYPCPRNVCWWSCSFSQQDRISEYCDANSNWLFHHRQRRLNTIHKTGHARWKFYLVLFPTRYHYCFHRFLYSYFR